ncbi:MAG: apolipoprotein A1/A4/E family protein [Candidatus Magnetomorum sp.]|nr:apolipoprotein A1/A4/E family protein [Candidatus Magnetomorum sp.]
MLQMKNLSTDLQTAFGPEQYIPLTKSFDHIYDLFDEQKNAIGLIQNDFVEYKKMDIERKAEIKKDLLVELATKADIEVLNGKINTLEQKMNGKFDTLEQKMNGKFDKFEQKMNGIFDTLEQKMNGIFDTLEQKMNGKFDTFEQKMNGKFDTFEQKMNGKFDTFEQKMNGKFDTLEAKLSGEFKSIRLWMKMLIGVAILGITCFSPTAQVLIKMLTF